MFKWFIALHVWLYRMLGGRGVDLGGRVLLLTTRGRKSGKERTVPLMFLRDGEGYLLAASAAGQPKHPAWFFNLRDNPEVTVQVGSRVRKMKARAVTSGEEREALYRRFEEWDPRFSGYRSKTERVIPVVVVRPA